MCPNWDFLDGKLTESCRKLWLPGSIRFVLEPECVQPNVITMSGTVKRERELVLSPIIKVCDCGFPLLLVFASQEDVLSACVKGES